MKREVKNMKEEMKKEVKNKKEGMKKMAMMNLSLFLWGFSLLCSCSLSVSPCLSASLDLLPSLLSFPFFPFTPFSFSPHSLFFRVTATNWSGPTEFLDETNGYPLPFSHLRPIPVGPFAGHAMAEPSELDLRSLLRHVVEAPDEARRKGARARADMIARFHPRVFAERLEADVRRISDAVAARARAQRLEARRRERGEEKEEDVEREEDGVAAPLRRFLSTMRERFWAHKSAEAPQAEDGEAEAEDRRKEGGSRSDL